MKMKGAKTLGMIVATATVLGFAGYDKEESSKTYDVVPVQDSKEAIKYLPKSSKIVIINGAEYVSVERERIENAKQFEQYLMKGRIDFSNANLSGLDFSEIDFRKYHGQYGALNFSNADMRDINLSGVYLVGANLSGTNLSSLDMGNNPTILKPKFPSIK